MSLIRDSVFDTHHAKSIDSLLTAEIDFHYFYYCHLSFKRMGLLFVLIRRL